jgi:hypothetical protein
MVFACIVKGGIRELFDVSFLEVKRGKKILILNLLHGQD